jgi:hypothetical protein
MKNEEGTASRTPYNYNRAAGQLSKVTCYATLKRMDRADKRLDRLERVVAN